MTTNNQTIMSIRTAFENVAAPTSTLQDMAKAFISRRSDFGHLDRYWPEVTADVFDVPHQGDVLRGMIVFMDGPTWRHYLPAWMSIGLLANDGEIISNALVTLDENASESVGTTYPFSDRISLLTDQQKQAVGNFVLAAVKHPDIADDPKSFELIKDLITRWTPYALD